jgi:hypothetical protein
MSITAAAIFENIRDTIIPLLNEYNENQRTAIEKITAEVRNQAAAETAAVHTFQTAERSLVVLRSNIERGVSQDRLPAHLILDYSNGVKELKRATDELNAQHVKFVDTARDAIDKVKAVSVNRVSHLKSVILIVSTCVSRLIEKCSDTSRRFRTDRIWADDFREFVRQAGLIRNCGPGEAFAGFPFTFEDPALPVLTAAPPPEACDVPVGFALVTTDFAAGGPFELSVNAGQKVFVFGKVPESGWIWVTGSDNTVKGFVPVQFLQPVEGEFVVLPRAQIEPSRVASVTTLMVKNREETRVICEDIDGHELIVSNSYLQ